MTALVHSLAELKDVLASLGSVLSIGYVRVSTDGKHQDSSVERQIFTYTQKGCNLVAIERESAQTDDRPLYKELIRLISLGLVREVITTRNDRLNRNQVEMKFFYNLCTEVGTAWIFIEEPELSSNSPWGIELRSQKAYEAQQESERLGRRQERAYLYAEEASKVIARTPTFGYRITETRNYEIDFIKPDFSNAIGSYKDNPVATGELARMLIELVFKKESARQALKHWKRDVLESLDFSQVGDPALRDRWLRLTSSFFCDWIRNPVLRGHLAYGKYKKILYGDKLEKKRYLGLPEHEWRIKWNTHPDQALVTEGEYQTIQKILDKNTHYGYAIAKYRLIEGEPATLSSILRCCCCKLRYVGTSSIHNGLRYRYYRCQGRKDFHCKNKTIPEKKLVPQVINAIVSQADKLSKGLQNAISGTVEVDSSHLNFLINEAAEAYKKYQITGMKEYLSLHQKFDRKIAQIEATRAKETEKIEQNFKLLQSLSSPEYWASLSRYDLHRYLKGIIRDCWIENGSVVAVDLDLPN